jgi:ribonucleoside-diphosphate reductase alpha chain
MRWLASQFLDVDIQEELGIMTPEVRARKAAQDALMRGDTAGPTAPPAVEKTNGGNGGGNGAPKPTASKPAKTVAAAEALTDTPPVIPAKLVGLDLGPACSACGGMMQRTGSCYTCSSCGNNTGCG